MPFDKNDVSESLTELRVRACTCLDKQIDVWWHAFQLRWRQSVKSISACNLMDLRMDHLYELSSNVR